MSVTNQAIGVGLRTRHFADLLKRPKTCIEWFEAISENFMNSKGRPLQVLETVRRDYPVALHGVSLSIASTDGLDVSYLRSLADLVDRIDPFLVSDHLCFSRYRRHYLHDLLPFPLTERALDVVSHNVDRVQSFLGRRLALENASVYVDYPSSEMSEAEFMRRLIQRTGCGILLDLNNLYVNRRNTGADPAEYFEKLPPDSILQMHLAGYSDPGKFYFDTHSAPVYDPVWDLFRQAAALYPSVPVCIEWDENIPEFAVLEQEVKKAARIRQAITAQNGVGSWTARQEQRFQQNRAVDFDDVPFDQELDALQKGFCDLLHSGQPSLNTAFRPAGELEEEEALLLYASGYVARREDALRENYRSTLYLLGAPLFYDVAHGYLDAVLSTDYDLNRYGRSFPEFLGRCPGSLLAIGSRCAQIDRAFVDALHEPAGQRAADRLQLDGSDVRLIFNPSLVLLELDVPAYDLWKQGIGKRDEAAMTGPAIDEEEASRRLQGGPEFLLVYRREEGVFFLVVQEWQFRLVQALQDHTLLSAVELHEGQIPGPFELGGFFRALMNEAVIVDLQRI